MKKKGFTLIELLIVVAIIAILAAIAVPNFLEAQVRSKVSRTKADMRSLATAIESYAVDNNKYPPDIENGWPWYITRVLSTPIAYITSTVLYDPFRKHLLARGSTYWGRYRFVNYRANIEGWGGLGPNYPGWRPASPSPSDPMWQEGMLKYGAWKLNSAGPDKTASYNPPFGFITDEIIYDPTNGTVSRGDIVRSQRESNVLTGG
ncbi:prepilin-type N-terminal cleavage/methylation domain-containing protein [Candidatus Sumerlaeota bacterium]|nr:prepilin-type N-terminal cleavage/methylation domain-containing protein [Candidatus Sumerlaeota bacterium]